MADPEITDIPTPAQSRKMIGHTALKDFFLRSAREGRLHHAWLLTGAEGIGKATFAWHAARYLLDPEGGASDVLERAPENPLQRQISAGAIGGLYTLQCEHDEKTGRKRSEIVVAQIRKLTASLALSNAESAYQVVIIDAAEELNTNAANAVLKILEEPPPKTLFFLISHRPGCLLAPIRSRCITHRLFALTPQEFDAVQAEIGGASDPIITALCQGAPGMALRLSKQNGAELYALILELFAARHAKLCRRALTKLSETLSGNENQARFGLFITLLQVFFTRLARAMITGKHITYLAREQEIVHLYKNDTNIAHVLAELSNEVCARLEQGRDVNVDPFTLLIDMAHNVEETLAKGIAQ